MIGDTDIKGQLDSLVSGKRRSRRRETCCPVRLKAVEREFAGIARNLSEGGLLIEVTHAELAGESDALLGPAEQLGLVETHFRDSFDVHFPDQKGVVEAKLVRISVLPEQPLSIFLGCEFAHPMGETLRQRLGLLSDHPAAVAWDTIEELTALTLAPDPRKPAFLLIFDAEQAVAGPRLMGPVTGLGPFVLTTALEGADCDALTEDLAGRSLRVQVMCGSKVCWEVDATLLACRYIDAPSGGSELGLRTESKAPRKVRKLFRKR